MITLGWCAGAAHAIYYAGDYMIVFYPLLLLLFPYAGAVGVSAIVGLSAGKWRFGMMAAVCVVLLFILVSNMRRIEPWAWSRSIHQHERANLEAINKCAEIPDLTDDTVVQRIWERETLPVLQGFEWYCEHHIAAPGGAFRVFRYHGIVHIRIQKSRFSYRGIAYIPSPSDKVKLEKDSQLTYEKDAPVGEHWVVWRAQ